MHTGKIKRLVRDRGFGFISDTDGRELFFHQSGLMDAQFDALNEEQTVEFEVEKSPKGPRAINVRITTQETPKDLDEKSKDFPQGQGM